MIAIFAIFWPVSVCILRDILFFIIAEEKEESRRQKRKTARTAEELIRQDCLDRDSDSSDSDEEYVPLSHRSNQDSRSVSPPLKRSRSSDEHLNGVVKKIKMDAKPEEKSAARDITKLSFVEKFFQRDIKAKLQKFTQEVRKDSRVKWFTSYLIMTLLKT